MNSASSAFNTAASGTNQRAMTGVRARVIEVPITKANGITDSSAEPGKSEALSDDPFSLLTQQGRIVQPPFDMLTLAMLPEHSSELGQCVEAMETNIDVTGHRFVSRLISDQSAPKDGEGATKIPADVKAAERREKIRLENFFMYATRESFVQFRRKLRRDLETTGNAYYEVIRNAAGQIQGFVHLPSYQMRLGIMDSEAIEAERKILELQENGSVKVVTQKDWVRFRRFVQARTLRRSSAQSVTAPFARWFKEFGDPRHLDKNTGEFGETVPLEKRATEVVHVKLYSARTPYGLPRYIGNLLSIFGDRAAEEINYVTFRNNNIPSMVVSVSNGQLTEGTIARIQEFVQSQIQGSDNYSKFLIIEGEPVAEDGEDGGQVKIDVKPLTNDQHRDALFQNYSSNNQDKIRRAFRLPPIFVGRSDDYTRATAEASRRLADEQIFAPERNEFDAMINRFIFPEMGIVFHKFKSNAPNTTDTDKIVRALTGAEKTGGMTPRICRQLLEDMLGMDLPPFAQDFPADIPFSMTIAEAVKNQADPTEPGQQTTAMKVLKALFEDSDLESMEDAEDSDSLLRTVKKMLVMNSVVEKHWKALRTAEDGDAA